MRAAARRQCQRRKERYDLLPYAYVALLDIFSGVVDEELEAARQARPSELIESVRPLEAGPAIALFAEMVLMAREAAMPAIDADEGKDCIDMDESALYGMYGLLALPTDAPAAVAEDSVRNRVPPLPLDFD